MAGRSKDKNRPGSSGVKGVSLRERYKVPVHISEELVREEVSKLLTQEYSKLVEDKVLSKVLDKFDATARRVYNFSRFLVAGVEYYKEKLEQAQKQSLRRFFAHRILKLVRQYRRLNSCGRYAVLLPCECGYKHFKGVSLCRDRFCPRCNTLRGPRFKGLIKGAFNYAINVFLDRYAQTLDEPLYAFHVVLTIPNVRLNMLKWAVSGLSGSVSEFVRYRFMKKHSLGYLWLLEITSKFVEFHPHIHLLTVMRQSYFDMDYMPVKPEREGDKLENTWLGKWRRALRKVMGEDIANATQIVYVRPYKLWPDEEDESEEVLSDYFDDYWEEDVVSDFVEDVGGGIGDDDGIGSREEFFRLLDELSDAYLFGPHVFNGEVHPVSSFVVIADDIDAVQKATDGVEVDAKKIDAYAQFREAIEGKRTFDMGGVIREFRSLWLGKKRTLRAGGVVNINKVIEMLEEEREKIVQKRKQASLVQKQVQEQIQEQKQEQQQERKLEQKQEQLQKQEQKQEQKLEQEQKQEQKQEQVQGLEQGQVQGVVQEQGLFELKNKNNEIGQGGVQEQEQKQGQLSDTSQEQDKKAVMDANGVQSGASPGDGSSDKPQKAVLELQSPSAKKDELVLVPFTGSGEYDFFGGGTFGVGEGLYTTPSKKGLFSYCPRCGSVVRASHVFVFIYPFYRLTDLSDTMLVKHWGYWLSKATANGGYVDSVSKEVWAVLRANERRSKRFYYRSYDSGGDSVEDNDDLILF